MNDLMDSRLSIPRLFGSLLTKIIVIFGLCLVVFSALFFKLKLWEQSFMLVAILFISFIVIGTVLVSNKLKAAALVASLTVLWTIVELKAPDIAQSARTMARAQQEHIRRAANDSAYEVPTAVTCDRTTATTMIFFARNIVTERREARVWYSEGDGRCWNGPGVHPQTGEDLIPVTPAIVERIRKRAPDGAPETESAAVAQSATEPQWGATYTFRFPSRP